MIIEQEESRDYIYKKYNKLLIYLLKSNKYFLFQTIEDEITGFKEQKEYSGYFSYPKSFRLKCIKKLSENRFMSISNYGIKIYALNEKKNNEIVLMDVHKSILNVFLK